MLRLETRLRNEGYYFPTQQQLASILYNESFGFRAEDPEQRENFVVDEHELTAEEAGRLIRYSRLATALVVINRVRQRIGRRPGWTETLDVPPAQRVTAPAERHTSSGYSLSIPGNQQAWDECQAVAGEALQRRLQPLGSIQHGYQFYSHTDSERTSTILADHIRVMEHIGPLNCPQRRPNPFRYLHLAFRLDRFEAALRWEQESVAEFLQPFGINIR